MILKKGDLLKRLSQPDLLLFSANSFIKKNGELVMGRGFALEIRELFPFLPSLLGEKIKKLGNRYGIAIVEDERLPCRIGAFQVKYHFKDPASLELIEHSAKKLSQYLKEHPGEAVYMNFPGVGYGRLGHLRGEILKVLGKYLGDNVYVWEKE